MSNVYLLENKITSVINGLMLISQHPWYQSSWIDLDLTSNRCRIDVLSTSFFTIWTGERGIDDYISCLHQLMKYYVKFRSSPMVSKAISLLLLLLITCDNQHNSVRCFTKLWRPKVDLHLRKKNTFFYRGKELAENVICPGNIFQNYPNISVSKLYYGSNS